jgi:GT2 family glycosyltransferase
MISLVLPTHNRPTTLQRTLTMLGAIPLGSAAAAIEVIIVDNASDPPIHAPQRLPNHLPVRVIQLSANIAAAARNIGVEQARNPWILMLDDDSYPLDAGFIDVLSDAEPDVAAIGAEILLADGMHEAGGLPEVIIGCGALIRRSAFLRVGGYDPAFDYYAEEYDLCAKLLNAGWRVQHDQRFRVCHEKIATHRDMNRILHRLVRNNAWVMQRYAPDQQVAHAQINALLQRYGAIAVKEEAAEGFALGVAELLHTLAAQPRRPMAADRFDRFTGRAHVRSSLDELFSLHPRVARVAIVESGKNVELVRQAIMECGVEVVADSATADALVIGTLSPGPMLDGFARVAAATSKPVIMPWKFGGDDASHRRRADVHAAA